MGGKTGEYMIMSFFTRDDIESDPFLFLVENNSSVQPSHS